jgi:hypothetical protein
LDFNWIAYWASTKAQTKQKKEKKSIGFKGILVNFKVLGVFLVILEVLGHFNYIYA